MVVICHENSHRKETGLSNCTVHCSRSRICRDQQRGYDVSKNLFFKTMRRDRFCSECILVRARILLRCYLEHLTRFTCSLWFILTTQTHIFINYQNNTVFTKHSELLTPKLHLKNLSDINYHRLTSWFVISLINLQ